jgi:outer membrane protein OmpA-like peptidoglycan-associated protein
MAFELSLARNGLVVFVLLTGGIAGCGFPLRGQLAQSEAEKLQLLTQLQQEQIRAAAAEAKRRELEVRLADAEKEAARYAGGAAQQVGGSLAQSPAADAAPPAPQAGVGWQQRSIASALRSLAEHHPGLATVENSDLGALDTSILFDAGQATLKPDAIAALDEHMKLLHAATGVGLRILVAGHAEQSESAARAAPAAKAGAPSADGQLEISAARAASVAAYLRRRGIAEAHIATVALGARQPSTDASTAAGQTRSRRAEIYLVGPQTPLLGANWRQAR